MKVLHWKCYCINVLKAWKVRNAEKVPYDCYPNIDHQIIFTHALKAGFYCCSCLRLSSFWTVLHRIATHDYFHCELICWLLSPLINSIVSSAKYQKIERNAITQRQLHNTSSVLPIDQVFLKNNQNSYQHKCQLIFCQLVNSLILSSLLVHTVMWFDLWQNIIFYKLFICFVICFVCKNLNV